MTFLSMVFIFFVSNTHNAESEVIDCPQGWINGQDKGCFMFLPSESNVTWLEAQLSCEILGGYLAEPTTEDEVNFVSVIASMQIKFTGIQSWWVGLTDLGREGNWRWQHSGQHLTEDIWWDQGCPNNETGNTLDCSVIIKEDGELRLRDEDCRDPQLITSPLCQYFNLASTTRTTTMAPASIVSNLKNYDSIQNAIDIVPISGTNHYEVAQTTTMTASITMQPTTLQETGKRTSLLYLPNRELFRNPVNILPRSGIKISATNKNQECEEGWTEQDNNCYKVSKDEESWNYARMSCQEQGGDLVSFHSSKEKNFVSNLVEETLGHKSHYIWLGGTDVDMGGVWAWSDGSIWNWGILEDESGDGKCLSMRVYFNTIYGRDCDANRYYYVCKK